MEAKKAIMTLGALAQESRLKVFRLLIQYGPNGLSAGKIGNLAKIPASSLSFHLKELTYTGLISMRQQGRFMFYSANFAMMTDLISFLTENCCNGLCPPACEPISPKLIQIGEQ